MSNNPYTHTENVPTIPVRPFGPSGEPPDTSAATTTTSSTPVVVAATPEGTLPVTGGDLAGLFLAAVLVVAGIPLFRARRDRHAR